MYGERWHREQRLWHVHRVDSYLNTVALKTSPLRTFETTDRALTTLVQYLVDDSSRYVSGNIYLVDAGVTLPGFSIFSSFEYLCSAPSILHGLERLTCNSLNPLLVDCLLGRYFLRLFFGEIDRNL